MKFLKNEKGFTLVEILVVIAIIAILFVTLLPQIDRAVDRARQTGVKTDFRSFQLASETYLRETNGKKLSVPGYESHLDVGLRLEASGGKLVSKEADSWGAKYEVVFSEGDRAIVIKSAGPNETFGDKDDFIMGSYYIDGTVASCTTGFENGDIVSSLVEDKAVTVKTGWKCGEAISTTGAFTEPFTSIPTP